MRRLASKLAAMVVLVAAAGTLGRAETLAVRPLVLHDGDSWTSIEGDDPATLPALDPGFERRTFWDLRPFAVQGHAVRYTIETPRAAGLGPRADALGADLALCASRVSDGGRLGCTLFRSDETAAAGRRALWSDLPADDLTVPDVGATNGGPRAGERPDLERATSQAIGSSGRPALQTSDLGRAFSAGTEPRAASPRTSGSARRVLSSVDPTRALSAGDTWRDVVLVDGGATTVIDGAATAEGIAVLPAGPREVVLVRESITTGGRTRLRHRFLTARGQEVAVLDAAPGDDLQITRASLLASGGGTLADNGIEISYTAFHRALTPGLLGFLQYGVQTNTALSALNPSWTGVGPMIAISSTNVPYQPDPGDPSTSTILPEVWNFTGLTTANLGYRVFNTVRSDLAGNTCTNVCSTRDVSAAPPDGTWQSYLKIDYYAPGGAFSTRNIFDINDNDTGANPSIDVPYVGQDENNVQGRTQLCFQQSAGGALRFLKFFRFTGASPATATMGVGDVWDSGSWIECDDSHGLRLTAASACGSSCWPGCTSPDPRGRGRIATGVGFHSTIVDDGWVKVPAGNYLPSLLMRQDTDIQAGLDFFSVCQLGTQNNRAFDYFWLNAKYGFMALVSSPANETMPGNDWTAAGNVTDGATFTWGPYPPYQTEARACLAGTKVSWSLPADGSNIGGAPGVSSYGYVVSWGSQTDPEQLADWTANPNHTPLPGQVGYLAAPAGSEPTSTVITGWPGASINATVLTALKYTDPDVADQVTYKSAALYKVTENPAKLSAATFRVGQTVDPFVARSGSNLVLSWPAVAGAASYRIKVYNLDTRLEIPCPGTLNCTPATNTATHTGAGSGSSRFGYVVFAVDPCGALSAD